MSNAFPKEVVVAWQESIEKFDSDNIVAKNCEINRTPNEQQFRSNFREWKPVSMISRTVDGLDISGSFNKDVTELSVPFDIDTIPNVPFTLDAKELNDPRALRKKINSAVDQLSARLNRDVVNTIFRQGGQTVTLNGAVQSYNDVAQAESIMIRQDVSQTTLKTMALNIPDYNTVAGNLASREYLQGNKSLGAYERSLVGDVASFDTFRTSFMPRVGAAAGASVTAGGAPQSLIPASNAENPISGNVENVDNRFFTLQVDSTANVNPGDRFTVAGVNEVSLINKNDTGSLRTFTVVGVVDGTNLQISPAPIALDGVNPGLPTQSEEEYSNVTVAIPDATALTWLNTAEAPMSAFWENDSICINVGNLAVEGLSGVNVMRDVTDSGIQLIIANEGNVDNLSNKYRVTGFWGITNKDPLKNGIMLANQV
jgi:hypothetical protein